MLGLRNLRNFLSFATQVSGNHRTLYAPSYFGVDKFKAFSEITKERQNQKKESIKTTLSELVLSQGQISTEDLKLMVYLADTPDEFDLVLNSVKIYEAQANKNVTEFSFGPLLMRLAYTMNQTNKILEIFLSENPGNDAFKEFKVGQMLMNKLFNEMRYDECIKVFDRMLKNSGNRQVQSKDGSTKHAFSHNEAIQMVAEALLEMGDSSAMSQMKNIFSNLKTNDIKYNKHTKICIFLLAIKNKEYEYADQFYQNMAIEYTDFFKNSPLAKNLEIINLCNLGKLNEAVQISKEILSRNEKLAYRFFQETLDVLAEATKKSPELLIEKTVENITDQITVSPRDLRKQRENELNDKNKKVFSSSSFTKPRKPSILE